MELSKLPKLRVHYHSDIGNRRWSDAGDRLQPGSRYESDARRESNTDA